MDENNKLDRTPEDQEKNQDPQNDLNSGDTNDPGDMAEDHQSQKPEDINILQEQHTEALRERDQFRSMAQRAMADLANYKKRTIEEMEENSRSYNSQILLKILSILDDLERAMAHIPDDVKTSGWNDGLNLVLRNVNNILNSEGVEKIEAKGQKFEPWDLEAVQYLETEDAEDGMVIKILREGYKHRGRLLRAAQVVVAKKSISTADDQDSKEESE